MSTVAPHRRRSINNHDNADDVITIVVVGDSEVTTSAGLFDVEWATAAIGPTFVRSVSAIEEQNRAGLFRVRCWHLSSSFDAIINVVSSVSAQQQNLLNFWQLKLV